MYSHGHLNGPQIEKPHLYANTLHKQASVCEFFLARLLALAGWPMVTHTVNFVSGKMPLCRVEPITDGSMDIDSKTFTNFNAVPFLTQTSTTKSVVVTPRGKNRSVKPG